MAHRPVASILILTATMILALPAKGQQNQPPLTACFIGSHGQRNLDSADREGYDSFKTQLSDENYKTQIVPLIKKPEIPQDCTMVVVAGPQGDFLPSEIDALNKYVHNGGRALIMLDAGVELPNLTRLLSGWGVTARNDLVIDDNPVAKAFGTEPFMPLIVKYGTNPIVQPLNGRATLFPLSRSFKVGKDNKPGITNDSLCDTSDDSYGVKDWTPKIKEIQFHPGTDLKGPLSVAVAGTVLGEGKKKTEGRFVVLGTSLIAANSFLNFQSDRAFMMNSINWLGGRDALLLNLKDESAHVNLGKALLKKGDWDGAMAEEREALRLNPKNEDAHTDLGLALAGKGDWDGATAEFREGLRLNPNNRSAHDLLGWALEKKRDWDGAIVEYREALRLNPKNETAHVYLGVALANKGDWDGAISEYREALRLNPNNDEAHVNLGSALGNRGDLDGAMVEEREALRLNPNNETAHVYIGMALGKKGDLDGA
ncbi:MAG TPA: tetratricopeptide repeat protein, partial [Terriglobia bacterium]|nr:tetratricopeptide repeat protein [Terriglobia bacterium]